MKKNVFMISIGALLCVSMLAGCGDGNVKNDSIVESVDTVLDIPEVVVPEEDTEATIEETNEVSADNDAMYEVETKEEGISSTLREVVITGTDENGEATYSDSEVERLIYGLTGSYTDGNLCIWSKGESYLVIQPYENNVVITLFPELMPDYVKNDENVKWDSIHITQISDDTMVTNMGFEIYYCIEGDTAQFTYGDTVVEATRTMCNEGN